jgi:hypothetical protein
MPEVMTEVVFERMASQIGETMGSQFRLQVLSQKAKKLKGRGKKLPRGFQLETLSPEKVGMSEQASDAFSPEALVDLFSHPAKVVDWDRLDEINYFWEGE